MDISRVKGALLGLACGDAVGTSLEFKMRGTFEPISDMIGGGKFNLKPGQWTDDTSVALCLAESLIEHEGVNLHDQMERYCKWYQHGYLSSTGECFDIGATMMLELDKYIASSKIDNSPANDFNSGNGALMRLAPVAMAYRMDRTTAVENAVLATSTTHRARECIESSALFCEILVKAFTVVSKKEILDCLPVYDEPEVNQLASMKYLLKLEDYMLGGGYVIDSLASALYAFNKGNSFDDCVLIAANTVSYTHLTLPTNREV